MPSTVNRAYRGTDYLLGILTLVMASLLLFSVARFLQPARIHPVSPGSFLFIAGLDDIASGEALPFVLEDMPWLLVRSGDDITAVSGYCTFRGARIWWNEEEKVFMCKSHGCIFGHRGNPLHGPAISPLETLRIRIVSDRVYGARDVL